jgi:hypothetical protein
VSSDGGWEIFVGSISAGVKADVIELLDGGSRKLTRGAGVVVAVVVVFGV